MPATFTPNALNWTPQQEMHAQADKALACVTAGDMSGAVAALVRSLKAATALIVHLETINENYRSVTLRASLRGRDTREGPDGQT